MTRKWIDRIGESELDRKLLERERVWAEATENICAAMGREGISRAELARRLGTSQANITKLLRGQNNFTLATLADIFFVLGHSFRCTYGSPTDEVFVTDESDTRFWNKVDAEWRSTGGQPFAEYRADSEPPDQRPVVHETADPQYSIAA